MLRFMLAHRNRDDEGATAVEYGLMVAAIAAVIVLVVFLLGGVVKDKFDKTCGAINTGDGTGTTADATCTTK
jgi:pilus assembly protein Flp/PilA